MILLFECSIENDRNIEKFLQTKILDFDLFFIMANLLHILPKNWRISWKLVVKYLLLRETFHNSQ